MASSNTGKSHVYDQVDAEGFVDDLWKIIQDHKLAIGGKPDQKVLEFTQPQDLQKILDLEITKEGTDKNEMLKLCENVIKYAVKTGHPHFYNQFYVNADTYSFGGAVLTDALNTNLHTYEVAPAFILTEKCILKKISSIINFKEYDGIFTPGGSFGNMMGLHLARYRFNKTLKEKGLFASEKLVMFCSEDAHYSLKKGASFMGFGTENCIYVKPDKRGRMDPEDLKAKILATKNEGNSPIFVVATSGTTVLGAFDPLDKIADVCEEHNLWLHVDAAWGGGVLVSEKHRHLMDGVHRVNSILWNFHKMMRSSIQCSAFLVQHPTLLEECNGTKASYLFQPDKGYDVTFDSGDKSIQCGRKADPFKLWVQWRARGDDGLAWTVDRAFENAEYLTERLREHESFRLVMPEFECTNICFWYIPPSMRGQEENDEWWQRLHKVTATIKNSMMTEGTIMIGYQPLDSLGFVNFFRIIICNPDLTHRDMDFVLAEINRLGKDL